METGIRPGEKLHEDLLTEDEARSTYDYGEHLIVYPLQLMEGADDQLLPGGERVPRGFRYSSDTNPEMLGVDDLVKLLATLP